MAIAFFIFLAIAFFIIYLATEFCLTREFSKIEARRVALKNQIREDEARERRNRAVIDRAIYRLRRF